MPGSADPRSQTKGRSLFAGMPDRQLAVLLIALVVTVELGTVMVTGRQQYSDLEYVVWPAVFALPVAIGALVAAVALAGLARDRAWGLAVGLIWAIIGTFYAAFVVWAHLPPSSWYEPGATNPAPLVFGIATVASIVVIVLLVHAAATRRP